MLTEWDKKRMASDVSGIISDWSISVDIWTPKPSDEQPNWNPILHEISGAVVYDKQIGVNAKRHDLDTSSLHTNANGNKRTGDIILHFPLSRTVDGVDTPVVVSDDSLIIIDGDESSPWMIKLFRNRLGKTVVQAYQMVGGS
jgi:hypothetical protein